jgi:tetratricopeptide (TPR) repeat protein
MSPRRFLLGAVALMCLLPFVGAQTTPATKDKDKKGSGKTNDVELVERLLAARKEYQVTLENLRAFYIQAGDIERARWAEEELLQYHRIGKQSYNLTLDVPPPTLVPGPNSPEANELIRRAMQYKDKGWNTDYVDNQRRAELLLQKVLTNYPQCDKIDHVAYLLGELYESKAYKQYDRAAVYYERCFQWNPKTHTDARLRAAHLYEKNDKTKAIQIYKEITTTEIDETRRQEAQKRLAEMGGASR